MADPLDPLWTVIKSRIGASPETSYTAKLLAAGPSRIAKKLGEEAVELAIAAAERDTTAAIAESADLLYHWLVLLAALGIDPKDVHAELARRHGTSGIAEKEGRQQR